MHLRSVAMKGFKSFPDRTRLDFSPGVSVIVGPNGSGKSNITDAVLWALGEQSPLAVRGQTMQDVIFAGGGGLPSRNAAEVEVVIDNSGGGMPSEFSELSIVRRLDRTGEGEYRMNGARCRLTDVMELLSESGLGKEMHSVVSQGRVEAIVHSHARDRRSVIEEAAGLGKHRKRRRRAELKLDRTEANLARALDVEREARLRLRPLKRQAEAAEVHARLERQSLEARLELSRDSARAADERLSAAEAAARSARGERDDAERRLFAVAARREPAEEALAAHSRARETLAQRLFAATSVADGIEVRLERAQEMARAAAAGAARRRAGLERLEPESAGASETPGSRVAELEKELSELRAAGGEPGSRERLGKGEGPLGEVGRRLDRARDEAARAGRELVALEELLPPGGAAAEVRDAAASALGAALVELEAAGAAARAAGSGLVQGRGASPGEASLAVRAAELEAELRAERRLAEQAEERADERRRRAAGLRARVERDEGLAERSKTAARALETALEAVMAHREAVRRELAADERVGGRSAAELRACARDEAQIQALLKTASDDVTRAEVQAQQLRDAASDVRAELRTVADRLGLDAAPPPAAPLSDDARMDLESRIERLARRREQLGPVNPLAGAEYEEAVRHVEELEAQRGDLESALAELQRLIRDTDRRIRESFAETFEATARNFEELVQHLFPGGRGRLRLVQPEGPRPVLGGGSAPLSPVGSGAEASEDPEEAEEAAELPPVHEPGVEVEVTPAGKATRRLSLLSGGEKALVALAFLFAVFLARPCPFYILDEVEAALDDPNIDRFLRLVARYSDRAQFIIVTHQRRTMDAADRLYGVSMGVDGVSKVVSRRLGTRPEAAAELGPEASQAAA